MNLLHENYLTVGEVAEIFRLADSTVYSWIKNKTVDAVQVGGSWRIPQSQFETKRVTAPSTNVTERGANE